ncbi:MAG: glutamine amidotransferase-related protein [Lawsonibacter sp.]
MILLPGVGAFGDAAARLRSHRHGPRRYSGRRLPQASRVAGHLPGDAAACLRRSFEYGEHQGLGLDLRARCAPSGTVIPSGLAIPHMGWNALHFPGERPRSPIFRALEEGTHVYFVHSFAGFDCKGQCTATTEYGAELTAAVQNGNVYGTQFHPEKSGAVGLTILKAFCELE